MLAFILYVLGAVLAYQTAKYEFGDDTGDALICAVVWPLGPFTRLYFSLFGK